MATLQKVVAASTDDGSFDVGGSGFSATGTNFVVGDVSASVYDKSIWLRFIGVSIPKGSTITSATLTLVATGGSVTPLGTVKIQAEAADSPAAPSNRADAIARTRTTASATWSGMAAISSGTYTTANFAAALQEVIDRTGWASGNAVQLFLTDNSSGWGGTAWQIAFANFNTASSSPATLNITYTPPQGAGTVTVTSTTTGAATELLVAAGTAPVATDTAGAASTRASAAGNAAAASTAAGAASEVLAAAGSASAVSDTAGAATELLQGAGTVVATSSTSGAGEVIPGSAVYDGAGTVAAVSGTSGSATVVSHAAGSQAASSALAGAASAILQSVGELAALSQTRGAASLVALAAGRVDVVSGLEGAATIAVPPIDVTVASIVERVRLVDVVERSRSVGVTERSRTVIITEARP